MISLVEAKHYRCLKYVRQPLANFHVLVGANASGKSTFLDVVGFVRDMIRDGAEAAVRRRAQTTRELIWQQKENALELAVEVRLPAELADYATARYEFRLDADMNLSVENCWLLRSDNGVKRAFAPAPSLFPMEPDPPVTIVTEPGKHSPAGYRKVMSRNPEGRVYVRSETTDWNFSLRPARDRAGLTVVPEEEDRFRATLWLKRVLTEGVTAMQLNVTTMRAPCPPDAPKRFLPDGSNLPLVVERLRGEYPDRYQSWVRHIQTVLDDVVAVETKEREIDRYRYLVVKTIAGLRLPSWTLSDGTLRFLALTLLAYHPEPGHIYFIEEPENGIHPRALEAVYQSLSSVYEGQVLCASHSPILLNLCRPEDLLCFARTESGATSIVRGDQHPRLKQWQRAVSLGDLLASGVLG